MKKLGASGVFWAVGIFAAILVLAGVLYYKSYGGVQFGEGSCQRISSLTSEQAKKIGAYLGRDPPVASLDDINKICAGVSISGEKQCKASQTTSVPNSAVLGSGYDGRFQFCQWVPTPAKVLPKDGAKKPRRADDTIRE